jgi:signal transduction histidine kinase
MNATLRVLQIEDSASDAGLIVRLLEKTGYTVAAKCVEDAAEVSAALANQTWDVIICDYHLPQFDAPAALTILRQAGIDIPFIVVSGAMGEDVAVSMMKAGAHDYVMKNNLARLGPAVEREIREAAVRLERRRALAEAERGRVLLDAVFAAQSDAVMVWGADGVVVRTNPAATRVAGLDVSGLVRQVLDGETVMAVTQQAGDFIVETSAAPMRDAAGNITGAVTISRDITERTRAEERLRQAQKLESIGLLAGGIAHDFNNILTAVSGNIMLALEDTCPDCAPNSVLPAALESVQRAAGLTRQLLAYAGKGAFVRSNVRVARVVYDAVRLLQASISKKIELRTELEDGLPPVFMDPSQLEQVVLNLILNGAEAIGENRAGTVTVRAAAADRFVRIEVIDTGSGMDTDTQKRILEPFFTTKFTGRGLGLAAVDGIVRAMRGEISVDSAPGRGTRVQVLLPASETPVGRAEASAKPQIVAGSDGAVLIVDDEPQIRKMARTFLKKRGITVHEAANGKEAVDYLATSGAGIRVMLLDMAMPEMTGAEALPSILRLRPDMKVIVSSGYSDADVKRHFDARHVHAFLPKPYSADQLVEHVLSAFRQTR